MQWIINSAGIKRKADQWSRELDSTDICQGLQTLRCILELLEFESYFLKGG